MYVIVSDRFGVTHERETLAAHPSQHNHFLAAAARALVNLSISSWSEAEHRASTAPISASLRCSIATSAAPSRSLTRRERSYPSVQGLLPNAVTGNRSYLTAR